MTKFSLSKIWKNWKFGSGRIVGNAIEGEREGDYMPGGKERNG